MFKEQPKYNLQAPTLRRRKAVFLERKEPKNFKTIQKNYMKFINYKKPSDTIENLDRKKGKKDFRINTKNRKKLSGNITSSLNNKREVFKLQRNEAGIAQSGLQSIVSAPSSPRAIAIQESKRQRELELKRRDAIAEQNQVNLPASTPSSPRNNRSKNFKLQSEGTVITQSEVQSVVSAPSSPRNSNFKSKRRPGIILRKGIGEESINEASFYQNAHCFQFKRRDAIIQNQVKLPASTPNSPQASVLRNRSKEDLSYNEIEEIKEESIHDSGSVKESRVFQRIRSSSLFQPNIQNQESMVNIEENELNQMIRDQIGSLLFMLQLQLQHSQKEQNDELIKILELFLDKSTRNEI